MASRSQVDTSAISDLVGPGEHRLLRRRLTAVLGVAAAAIVAAAVGVAALDGGGTPRPAPIDRPSPQEEKPLTRPVVYSDMKVGVSGHTVHFGDRLVETGNNHVHLDVTDDGFLYTDRGAVWFSDGGTPERVGSACPGGANSEFGNFAIGAVMTADSGSMASWFDCTQSTRPTLVVFDTSSRHVVARRRVPFCCEVADVTSHYVYFDGYRFDPRADQLRASTPREYAADLRSQPRGLIVGGDWKTGTPTGDGFRLTDGSQLRFAAAGSRLEPMVSAADTGHQQLTSAFDTATRRALRLRLPEGYHVETGHSFILVEWLDDDTVALFGGGRADILTCQLSTGRCAVAVPGPDPDTWRIVPNYPLPG